jgi:protocatechuate 3,4-dioxygenase beta subunit
MLVGVALATALHASQSSASIGGQVLNSADEEPVNGVVLVLTAAASASTPLKFVTETRGLFLFENLAPGRYVLFAESEGFARQVFGSHGNPLAGVTLTLAPGQEMNDLQFNLTRGSTISGKVLDALGNPVRKAAVLALQPIYRRGSKEYVPLGSAASGENGEYRVANLAPGNYLLSAAARDGEGVATFYPNSSDLANAAAVTVGAGAAATGTDIRMVKAVTFRVAGKLAVENAAAAIAWLTRKGAGATALVTRLAASIESDGGFVFPNVPPGTYALSATEQDGVAPASAPLNVVVTAKDIEGIVLKPESSGELPGTISMSAAGVPLPKGVQVVLEAADTLMPRPPRAAVGDDGKFTVKKLAAGRYIVHMQMPETFYVRSVRYRGLDVTENGFEFGGGVPALLLISLSADGAVVEGRVRGADGFPMPGAVVALVPSVRRYSRYKETTTDQYGAYTMAGVAPGEYKIYSWDQIETGAYQNAEWLKQFELKGRAIVAKQDGHETVALRAIE